ncbi:hypothetical protein FRC11_014460 [Ceratobasidium sp. 423]|nr:hypothetical protein FRC11_014460 [Ceratobasidium sp. 423]
MPSNAGPSSGPSHGQKRKRNPDPYNDFGDGEYLGDETLRETNEVNKELEQLPNIPSERMYKSVLRMSPSAFETLLGLIKEDHIFFGPPQPPLKYQLAVYLARHGATGQQPEEYSNSELMIASFYGLREHCFSLHLPDHFLDDLEQTDKRAIKKVVNRAKGTTGSDEESSLLAED